MLLDLDFLGRRLGAGTAAHDIGRDDPNDALALFLTAKVNLCDCVQGWSKDTAEQQRIGADALEKSLRREPDSISGLAMKVDLLTVRGQYEEALTVADTILKRDPDDLEGLSGKAYLLLSMPS